MQIKIFTIPITDDGTMQEEMNKFLRGHKVLETESHIISNHKGAYWCFCIKFLSSGFNTEKEAVRKDYKELLDENTFARFAKMREIRKKLALEDGVPAYAVFTDAELAAIAKLEQLTIAGIKGLKGIGDKKAERYGAAIMEEFNKLS
jgi:superfamily II DNA helicase RecQ